MKAHPLTLAVVFIAALCLASCSHKDNAAGQSAAALPVLIAPVIQTNIPVQLRAIGNVTPVSKVTVRSQITGKIQTVNFKEGQAVKRGDQLFTIDPRPAQATLAHDKAQLENATLQFAREQKLLDQKVISQDEYDTSKANRDALAATVQADELNLSYCEILSPVDGVTGSQQVFAGNIVKSPDDVMLTINQIHPIYVTFAVPEQYLAQIKNEMAQHTLPVTATFTGLTGPPPQGELTFVDNAVDPTTGTIQLKGTFPNEDGMLWPGQFVQVALKLSEIPNALVVPSQAIQTGQSGQYIYLVKPDQTVELRNVEAGLSFQGGTVLTSGVHAGETVVTDGQLRLTPGTKVSVKSADVFNTASNAAPGQP